MTRKRMLLVCGTALISVLLPRPAAKACKFATPRPHVLDPALTGVDVVPPEWETSPAVGSVRRGSGDEGCFSGASSCDGIGTMSITVAARDDRAAAESIGFRLRVISGTPPGGFAAPERDVRPLDSSFGITMTFSDPAGGGHEPFDFTLAITPVDLAGNLGETRTVTVSDPGSGGCAIAGPGIGALWPTMLLALVVRRSHRQAVVRQIQPGPTGGSYHCVRGR
ncbi:MAG TPA: hypothetical protein VFH73_04470 [Polyangia bacterium]|jgi:hypothetical protein|nr:hypothetical protein [Polyangia bacterium]